MKLPIVPTLPTYLFAVLVVAAGCSDGGNGNSTPSKTGGQTGAGGAAKGGSSGSGGASASGGASGSGGKASGGSSGGSAAGGNAGSGGAGSGGSAGSGAGGSANGGSGGGNQDSGSGGVAGPDAGKDGSAATGGVTGTGGTGVGSGGTSGTAGSPASGGASATGGGSGTGGTSAGGQSLCKFASGLNIAWVQFAGDVPNPNIATFSTIFKNTYDNGGRIVRWWFHTNGTVTPGYDSSGKAKAVPQSHIDDVKKILAAADAAKIGVVISLWSFDMLQANATCTGDANTSATCKNNHALLEQDANRQAYVDNYLTPLVQGLKGTPGLYAYEIFNEAEGMMESGANGAQPWGWATERTTKEAVQKCVNWFSAAIHDADPSVPVTTGAQTFDYCSNGISGKSNYYSDSALQAVGSKAKGTLDFYQVHYYAANGATVSCYTYDKAHWGLTDKKVVMGEFYAAATDGTAAADTYTKIYSNGYDGAWGWSYTEGDSSHAWPTMQTPMKNLFTAHSDVGTCP